MVSPPRSPLHAAAPSPDRDGDAPPADPHQQVEVSVRLRRRPGAAVPSPHRIDASAGPARAHLGHDVFGARYGADEADLDAVAAFAEDHGLEVVEASTERRTVVLQGSLGIIAGAFGADVRRIEIDGVPYRRRVGELHVPPELEGIVEAVFGFSNHPRARPYIRLPGPTRAGAGSSRCSLYATDLARLYEFPEGYDGRGQCIAVLAFGGGYRDEDLDAYFGALGVGRPEVVSVLVSGAGNLPGIDETADAEVALDVEIAGGVAPGARIAVYFAEWSERGWIDALNAAVHDRVNTPDVISISWGWAELERYGGLAWSQATIDAVNAALEDAALLGVTVVCAAGDEGSGDGIADGERHVDFPASSPFVLGCGGTSLHAEGGVIVAETAWSEGSRRAGGGTTGGGVSLANALPDWQEGAGVPPSSEGRGGRGVPDIAGAAGGACGHTVRFGGREVHGVVGTSAVAPLYAGLVARINQALGRRVGFLNPLVYRALGARGVFRDVTTGCNDAGRIAGFSATRGWDPCTGWGSIRGAALLEALGGARVPPSRTVVEPRPRRSEPPPTPRRVAPRTAPAALAPVDALGAPDDVTGGPD